MATPDELFQRAVAAHQSGALDEAEQGYRQLLEAIPGHPACLTNLGSILAHRGETDEAERFYLESIASDPNQLNTLFNLGNLYRRTGRSARAVPLYEDALRLSPNAPLVLVNLGLAVSDGGDWPRAVECFARAVTVTPDVADGLNLLGDALARCGRRDEAIAAFREVVSRFSDSPRGYCNLGLHLAAAGQTDEAIETLERAVALRTDYPEAHNALGVAYEAAGRTDDAQVAYRMAVHLRPDFVDAWANLGTSLGDQGRTTEAVEALRRALELAPNPIAQSSLLSNLLFSSTLTPEQLRDEHVTWATAFADPLAPAERPRKRDPNAPGRVRVGYVFGEFRSRAAFAFLETLLTHHDRKQFHITAYPNSGRQGEDYDRLRRLADSWKPIAGLPDDRAANLIRSDEIDILVDLNGHAPGNRLLVFARGPAPTQIGLFSYPATTGMRALDFRVTDGQIDPPGAESLYTEKLLRLPDLSWLYVPPENAPAPNPLPASRRAFTFGCLNHPGKLSDACVGAWAEILKAVPKSRLVLLAGQSVSSSEEIAARFTQRGIVSDRLELVYRLSGSDYFEAYQPLDVTLDPFPYGGAVTTCDSLWMGVPVLTVAGHDARGRQGMSLLNALGLPEFIADTPEQLVTLAATWADQRDALADLRSSLRDMVAHSPLTDAATYVKHLEAAYRSA
ncbi:tetratricopeptide repeat protein [Gemmata sp. G18]|uniref:protein O-GlcNAc transferase n=1 Tax=Gemmata palustris TaxID=2822762 RepID=A0ABS5BYP4_9BACT|nr:tetratricopeptide repeat protein [Gemmata palustris]MBP3958854.1 tetratricopeptide repeat protein [Gemmata palustris]